MMYPTVADPVWVTGLFYLLKVSLLSGLLYGYYRIFLRNRLFHQYNRFYLLGAAFGSLVLPLLHGPAGPALWAIDAAPTLSGALHRTMAGDWKESFMTGSDAGPLPVLPGWREWTAAIYLLVSGVLFFVFLRQLYYIMRLRGRYPREKMGGLHFFMTKEPGSPFSFLNNIFWNDQLDIYSSHGQQIFPGGKRTIRESVHYRTEMANRSKADLFVSLHTDADGGETNVRDGKNMHAFHIYVSPANRFYSQSARLGSTLIDALKGDYATGPDLIESKQGLWVLQGSAMPAVLVLCGNISDPTDLAFVGKETNQEKIARDILQGIVRYKTQAQTGGK